MEKLKFETPDMVAGNIEKIGALFPSAITEMRGEDGQIKKGINFEVLKQLLSRDVVDGDECYEFTWVGKKAAMAEAARPITKTLRPVKEDSRDWDTTQNLYIEGDNLEVLKILQESRKHTGADGDCDTDAEMLCLGFALHLPFYFIKGMYGGSGHFQKMLARFRDIEAF